MVCDLAIRLQLIISLPCLNPCFNGIWSATFSFTQIITRAQHVLILVLMEYGLRHKVNQVHFLFNRVLILVLMEYGLRQHLL